MENEKNREPAWLFQRNELDLLEQDFRAAWADAAGAERPLTEVEEEVLTEVDAIDDAAHAELTVLFDAAGVDDDRCPVHGADCQSSEEDASIAEMLDATITRDPLSSRAFQLARSIADWCRTVVVPRPLYREHFRLRVNAPLFAAKIAFAAQEESVGDDLSTQVAMKELDVGMAYLRRVTESLEVLMKAEVMAQGSGSEWLREAEGIMAQAEGKRGRWELLMRFRGKTV